MRSRQYDFLVVDDDADDRIMLGEAFAELNSQFRVTMYDSSAAFLQEIQALKQLSPLPLLIILDYNLPGMDGGKLLRLLKADEMLKSIPIVMYSTSMSRTQQTDCINSGAITCFEKGLTYNEVLAFVSRLCEEAGRLSATS